MSACCWCSYFNSQRRKKQLAYAKNLREKLGRVAAQLQGIINKCKTEGERGLTGDERERFNRLVEEHNGLEASIEAAELSDSIQNKLARATTGSGILEGGLLEEVRDTFRTTPQNLAERRKDPHYRAFSNYLRLGESGLTSEDRQTLSQFTGDLPMELRNAMSTTTGSQGGYTIPQGFSDQLEIAKKWFGGIGGAAVGTFTTATGNPFPWPTTNDTVNKGRIIGQNVQLTETDLTFGQVTFNAYIGSSDIVLVPLALTQDSYFDMDALVAQLLGIRLGRLRNNMCTVGTGTAEPTGIITAVANGGSGNVLQLGTGNTTTISYANLVDLEHSVDPDYRYNPKARWMFSDQVLKTLKLMVDSNGRPLWQPAIASSFRQGAPVDPAASNPTILDHPYTINQDMASPAASAYTILFGDMQTFKVREVAGGVQLMVLRERYADYLQVGFCGFERYDSQYINAGTNPIAVLQQSAS
jgi:HK97 family phage major capsid protein